MSGSIWADIAQGNYLCNVSPWLTDNFYEENNLYKIGLTSLAQPQVTKMKMEAKDCSSEKRVFKKQSFRQSFNVNKFIRTTFHRISTYSMLAYFMYLFYHLPRKKKTLKI